MLRLLSSQNDYLGVSHLNNTISVTKQLHDDHTHISYIQHKMLRVKFNLLCTSTYTIYDGQQVLYIIMLRSISI